MNPDLLSRQVLARSASGARGTVGRIHCAPGHHEASPGADPRRRAQRGEAGGVVGNDGVQRCPAGRRGELDVNPDAGSDGRGPLPGTGRGKATGTDPQCHQSTDCCARHPAAGLRRLGERRAVTAPCRAIGTGEPRTKARWVRPGTARNNAPEVGEHHVEQSILPRGVRRPLELGRGRPHRRCAGSGRPVGGSGEHSTGPRVGSRRSTTRCTQPGWGTDQWRHRGCPSPTPWLPR
jgi:hypothetical protein